jgi:hypothetical protein
MATVYRRISVGAVGGAENAKRIRRAQIFEGGFDFNDKQRMRKLQGALNLDKEVFQPEHRALIQVRVLCACMRSRTHCAPSVCLMS